MNTSTELEKCLTRAREAATRVRQLEAMRPKLSAESFLDAAYRNAMVGETGIRAMVLTLQKHQAEAALTLIRRLRSFIVDGFQGGHCSSPPRDVRRVAAFAVDRAQAEAELGAASGNLLMAMAAAALEAVERFPEAFGEIEDLDAHQAEVAVAKAMVIEEIELALACLTMDDITVDVDTGVASLKKYGVRLGRAARDGLLAEVSASSGAGRVA